MFYTYAGTAAGMKHIGPLFALSVAPFLSACGGGGGGAPTPVASSAATTTTGSATPSPGATVSPGTAQATAAPAASTLAGTVFSDSAALANATVVVGPVPIVGATAPAMLPSGDVATTTTAGGAFAVTTAVGASAPSASEPFVVPPDNILGTVPPASGYYVEVFAAGGDGMSAGTVVPLHRFVAASSALTLMTTTIAAAEASALTAVNADRASFGATPLTFDAVAELVARAHATGEVTSGTTGYYCHYDTHNVGPTSRYLAAGGLGLTGENLGMPGSGVTSSTYAFQVTESATLAEQSLTPPGGHFLNLIDTAHRWAGLAAIAVPATNTVFTGGFYAVDYELVTPNAVDTVVGAGGYPNASTCPAGTMVNDS
jgi:uncharacterized protein YkwD